MHFYLALHQKQVLLGDPCIVIGINCLLYCFIYCRNFNLLICKDIAVDCIMIKVLLVSANLLSVVIDPDIVQPKHIQTNFSGRNCGWLTAQTDKKLRTLSKCGSNTVKSLMGLQENYLFQTLLMWWMTLSIWHSGTPLPLCGWFNHRLFNGNENQLPS